MNRRQKLIAAEGVVVSLLLILFVILVNPTGAALPCSVFAFPLAFGAFLVAQQWRWDRK